VIVTNIIVEQDMESISSIFNHDCEGKTFLITGASGFLPFYMCQTLLFLNDHIFIKPCKLIAVVRNRENATAKFKDYIGRSDLEFVVQDVCDPLKLENNIDYIIHAASQASPKYYGIDPVGTLSANVLGTINLLELARKNNITSFLYFSSGEVYGQTEKTPTTEKDYGYSDPMDVRNCYLESKRMGENICVSYLKQYNIPIKIIRPFHTYGPGMLLDDGRVFADFVKNIVHGEDIILKSDGKAVRTFCYIADATKAFFTVLFKGVIGEAYNVSNDQCSVSIAALAELMVHLFADKNLKVIKTINDSVDYIPSKIQINYPDITKIRTLGWSPETGLENGFKKTVLSFL
jgi:UDP-glucuronate decarboxylase